MGVLRQYQCGISKSCMVYAYISVRAIYHHWRSECRFLSEKVKTYTEINENYKTNSTFPNRSVEFRHQVNLPDDILASRNRHLEMKQWQAFGICFPVSVASEFDSCHEQLACCLSSAGSMEVHLGQDGLVRSRVLTRVCIYCYLYKMATECE